MDIEQYAGKITARLAKLSYKITDELEKKDKKLSENGHGLDSEFRRGFMLAQDIVNQTIDKISNEANHE